MELISYAKINIGLTIKGYSFKNQKHKLESLFLLVDDYCDYICIEKSTNDCSVVKYYQQDTLINIENDLVTKTITYFQNHFHINDHFDINIKKNIPSGAGLGGSSSNAGSIINFLIKTYNLTLSSKDWLNVALDLGSDVTFFASGYKMALVSGYGNKICLIDKPFPKYQILPNDLKCFTKEVYQTYHKSKNPLRSKTNFWKLIESLPMINNQKIFNDLQEATFIVNPQLFKLYRNYGGERKIFLTGSGSFFVELF